jgi:hypothetical protein
MGYFRNHDPPSDHCAKVEHWHDNASHGVLSCYKAISKQKCRLESPQKNLRLISIKQNLITEESILKRPFQFSAYILSTD